MHVAMLMSIFHCSYLHKKVALKLCSQCWLQGRDRRDGIDRKNAPGVFFDPLMFEP